MSTFASRAAARNKRVNPATVTGKTAPEVRGEADDPAADADADLEDPKPAKKAAKKRPARKKTAN